MNKWLKIFLICLLVFFIYHFVRDIMQIMGAANILTIIGHRDHLWCGSYCKQITIIPEILSIIAIVFIFHRKKFGTTGIVLFLSLPLWIVATLLP